MNIALQQIGQNLIAFSNMQRWTYLQIDPTSGREAVTQMSGWVIIIYVSYKTSNIR